jgi:hypothetical protein
MRKITVQFIVHVDIEMEDNAVLDDVLSDMDYNFNSLSDKAEVTQTEIMDQEIIYNSLEKNHA